MVSTSSRLVAFFIDGLILFGDKWMAAVPFVCIACFEFALWPFHTINLQTITALGRSDLYLKLEIAKKVLISLLVLASFRSGVWTMMATLAFVGGTISWYINSTPVSRLLGYGLLLQFRDVLPTFFCCSLMAVSIWFIPRGVYMAASALSPLHSAIISLVLQSGVGGAVFLGLSWLFGLAPLQEVLGVVNSRRKGA